MPFSEIEWASYDGPHDYRPDDVPAALSSMSTAASGSEAKNAYQAVLSAIGNSHAGTWYPAAAAAVEHIIELAASNQTWVRHSAQEVLRDYATSFVSEPGFETVELPNGSVVDLAATVRHLIDAAGIDLDLD